MADALHTPGVVSAQDARLDDAGLIAPQASTLAVRTGVLWAPGSTALVTGTPATAPMRVQVAAHHWVTTRNTSDGVYRGTLEAATLVNIAAAPGSNSRIDVVWSKQNDAGSAFTPDGSTAPQYGVTTGTAAVSPTKPPIPVGAVELATVTVAAGATATNGAEVTIANTARQTVARGAPVPVRNDAERDALDEFNGLSVKRLDAGGVEEQYISGAWVRQERRPPVSASRTSGVVGLPVNPSSTVAPAGTGLTLPALPVGHVFVVELSTGFYVEGSGSPQNLTADIVATGATLVSGVAMRQLGMSSLPVTVHTRQTFQVTSVSPVSFASSYFAGPGTPRVILQREDWTAWL